MSYILLFVYLPLNHRRIFDNKQTRIERSALCSTWVVWMKLLFSLKYKICLCDLKFTSNKRFIVRLGEHDTTDRDDFHKDMLIAHIDKHEGYNNTWKINDIAILHLWGDVLFNGATEMPLLISCLMMPEYFLCFQMIQIVFSRFAYHWRNQF